MLRKSLLALFCVLIGLIAVQTMTAAGRTQETAEVVRVGWVGALTGDMAVWGNSEFASTQMFFEQLNAQGGLLGRRVEVVGLDSRGDTMEAINVTRRLGARDRVIGIIGPNTSGQAIAMISALEETRVAGIATVATNPRVTVNAAGQVNPFNFRVAFVDNYQGAVAAGFTYEVLGATTAAVLFDVGSDYSQGITEFFVSHFQSLGGRIVGREGFNPGDVDFRPQLTRIQAANPAAIFMPFTFNQVALATAQARELGITATFIGTDTWPSAQLLQMTRASGSIEGAYIVNHLDINDPSVAWLLNMYVARNNRQPEINAFLAWDACQMLVEAVRRANSFDPVAIRDQLVNTNFTGVTGPIRINPRTHSPEGKVAAILTVRNNQFVFVQNYSPFN